MTARAAILALALAVVACGPAPAGPGPRLLATQPASGEVEQPSPDAQRPWSSAYPIMEFPGGRLVVRLERADGRVVESITNEYRVAVTLDPTRTTINLREVRAPAATVTVPAGQTVAIAEWTIVDPAQAWSERSHFFDEFGDPAAQPDGYVYALPFAAGETFKVSQGFNGTFSHTGASQYAVDFTMPEGTEVRAARDGVVVAFHAGATGAGVTDEFRDRTRANWVYVLHADGTLGMYWHLAPGGVRVEAGQRVERGDVIGLSGFTGYAQIAHLHFAVVTAETGARARTFPFVLRTSARDRDGTAPVEQQRYTAFE
jgi:murein DD-endopeptidase MepM/ murein hydrolase activator NlpD